MFSLDNNFRGKKGLFAENVPFLVTINIVGIEMPAIRAL
jgi:hypothetical protein